MDFRCRDLKIERYFFLHAEMIRIILGEQGKLLAPHTSGPRDVPRCGALSLLQKDAALQGGSSRNRYYAERQIVRSGGARWDLTPYKSRGSYGN